MSDYFSSREKMDLLIDGCKIITSGISNLSSIHEISDQKLKKSTAFFVEEYEKLTYLNKELQCIIKNKNTNEDVNILVTGRISTGKSKILNALLRRDILKSSAGHTTRSFIRISKSQDENISSFVSEKYVKTFRNDNELKNCLEDNTSFQYNNPRKTNEVTILLPRRNNPLLMENVFIYDSPGFGKEYDSTIIIEEKCQIADILVFVVTNNITMESMLIFDKLKRFAAVIPTIILVNKWDETDRDDKNDVDNMMEDIENTITKRIRSENDTDARHWFFYISGKEEMLNLPISSQNKKGLRRHENFTKFIRTLQELIKLAPKEKQNRFSLNYQQVLTELNVILKNFDSERNTLVKHLQDLLQQFNDISQKSIALLNEIESRKKQIPYKIEIIKNEQMRKPDQSSFINKISEIYKPFDEIYEKCKNVMSLFMDFLPNKKKKIEACYFKLESKKRRITELSNQCQRNWSNAIATGTAAAGAAGLGVAAVAAGMGAVAFAPFAIAAGLGYYAWNCWGKSKENENEIKMDIKFLIEKSDKYGEVLIDAYDFLKVAIKDSGIKNDCETSLDFLQRFLANIMENKKKVDEAFY